MSASGEQGEAKSGTGGAAPAADDAAKEQTKSGVKEAEEVAKEKSGTGGAAEGEGKAEEAAAEGAPAGEDGAKPASKIASKVASKASAAGGGAAAAAGGVVGKVRGKGEKPTPDNCKFGFLGAGKMAEAIIRGLLEKKTGTDRLFVASKNGKNHDIFKQLGAVVTKRTYDLFGKHDCDVIFMVVHGLAIKECFKMGGTRPLALTTNFIPTRTNMIYILSLVGGIPCGDVKKVLLNPDNPEKYKLEIHRIMLNASVSRAIGLGAIDAEIDSKKVSPIIRDVLFKIAKVEYYPESQMDILCAVGGNGMAFTYYFVSALADGGFKMGLPKKTAVSLATKTLHCTALCMLESGKHPSELRDSCTAPSGPAIYGIANLEKRDCASGIASAVEAASKRIKELVENPCS